MNRKHLALYAALGLTLATVPARADDAAFNRLRDQMRQAVLEKRQLEDENFQLKSQLAAAKAAQAQARPEPPAPKVPPELIRLRQESESRNDRIVAMQAESESLRAQLEQTGAELSRTTAMLRDNQNARQLQGAQLQASLSREKLCADGNARLSALAAEVLDRYRQQGFWEALREHESVTGLYRVRLENLLQDLNNTLRDATLPPASEPAAGSETTPAAAVRNNPRIHKAENT